MIHTPETQQALWQRHRNLWFATSLATPGATTTTLLVDVPPGAGIVITGFSVSGISAGAAIATAQLQFDTTDIWSLWIADIGLSLREQQSDLWLPCANGSTLRLQTDVLENGSDWTVIDLTVWGHFNARLDDQGAVPYL